MHLRLASNTHILVLGSSIHRNFILLEEIGEKKAGGELGSQKSAGVMLYTRHREGTTLALRKNDYVLQRATSFTTSPTQKVKREQ